jgi:hypothetical protein
MTQIVFLLRPVESSIRRPTFPARELGPSVVEAETISSQDCPAPGSRSWALASPSLPLCRSCPKRFGPSCGPRNQRRLHGQVASKLDPASSPNRTPAPLGHQRLGGPSVAAKAAIRSTPWARLKLNETSTAVTNSPGSSGVDKDGNRLSSIGSISKFCFPELTNRKTLS